MRRIRRSAGGSPGEPQARVPDLPLSTDVLCAQSGRTMEMPVAKTRPRAKAGTFLFCRPAGLLLSFIVEYLHSSAVVDADCAVV